MHTKRITRHLSYANVIASLALFIALGGASYAAVAIPANSVGTNQLKKSAVAGSKIKKNAISSAKVKDGSLQRGDFASGTLLQGAQGIQGPKGDPGPQGDAGPPGPFPGVLPSGKTMRGAYGMDGVATSAGYPFRDAVSFGFSLPAGGPAVQAHFVAKGGSDQNCPGSEPEPEAAPGHLCIFEEAGVNHPPLKIYLRRSGAILYTASALAGYFTSSGTWAVTAP
jgi:hypothetical protein